MIGSTKMGRMPPSKHDFSRVPKAEIQRSSFDRSFTHKTMFDSGYLVPFFADEVLPGDTHSLSVSSFCRLSTPLRPVMDNLYMDMHFWYVPWRLIWNNFQKFMGEQDNPGDSTSYLIPTMTSPASGPAVGSLSDYLGIPTVGQVASTKTLTFNSFFHRCYNLIYNQCYRDQNLQDSVVVDKDDGPDTYTDYVLLKSGKRHDYFTSALPTPQKGDAATIPLGTRANIAQDQSSGGNTIGIYNTAGTPGFYAMNTAGTNLVTTAVALTEANAMYADLSTASAASVNLFRQAVQIQRFLEMDARGGTRYTELVQSHFNVTSPDFRLQRPEYLGGGSTPINVAPIPQTSSTDVTTPQGNLAAMGTFGHQGVGFTKSFTEHCLILGLISVRADLNYQQGLNRMWSRSTRYDFYWPALSHIGEQAVLNKEIYCQGSGAPTVDADVFGYQERYAEYRYKPSQITGLFRSTAASNIDQWHLAQEFSSLPVLNSTFIQETPPMARVKAVPAESDFLFDAYFDLKCARPIPVRSLPGMVDHF